MICRFGADMHLSIHASLLLWTLPLMLLTWPGLKAVRWMRSSNSTSKLYIAEFQAIPERKAGDYIQNRIQQQLKKSRGIEIVRHLNSADFVLRGNASLWISGYRSGGSQPEMSGVPVYDAKLSVCMEDRSGSVVWSETFKPGIWGSKSVSDNIANQAASRVTKFIR